MTNLKDYVNWKLTHADKTAEAEGYPLVLENCKANKRMKQLEIYGNSFQDGTPTPDAPIEVQSVGELVTDVNDVNYGKYKIPVVQRGVNLFSMAKAGFTEKTVNGITFTPLDDERIHIKGKLEDATKNALYNPVLKNRYNLKAGIYNLKGHGYTSGLQLLFGMYKNGNFVVNLNHNSYNQNLSETLLIQHIYLAVDAGNTREWDDIISIQITKGSGTKNLPYEPYIEPVTTNIFLDEPLRKIGDYADYIDFKENKVVRTIKEHIITGAETILPFGGSYPYSVINIGDVGYVIDDICLCNSFAHQSNFSVSREGINTFRVLNSYSNNASRIGFRLYVDGAILNDENIVKPILKDRYQMGNPVIFYYGLSEPFEEFITIELPKLTAKTTIIEVDTSLLPGNMYGKYIKR